MKRRHILHAAAASALLAATERSWAVPLSVLSPKPDYMFFDERYQKARSTAASWRTGELVAVQGDITPFWSADMARAMRTRRLHLLGVTTESFLFCLRILAGEHADLALRVSRLDANLLQWAVRTTPQPRYGSMA